MTREEIIILQKRIGTIPDGIWGPKSIAACHRYLLALMPEKNPWPKYSERIKFYGQPGNVEMIRVSLPSVLYLYGDKRQSVTSVSCHFKCADSLFKIFTDIYNRGLWSKIKSYDGIFNHRHIAGTKSLSNHSWACAIDLNHSTNGNYTHWPTVADFPFEIMECFAREGWYSAGAFWGRDATHHEAVQP